MAAGRHVSAILAMFMMTTVSAWLAGPCPSKTLFPAPSTAPQMPPPRIPVARRLPGCTRGPFGRPWALRSSHDCNHHFDEEGGASPVDGVSSDLWGEDGGEEGGQGPPLEYDGPVSAREMMEAGVEIGDIGLEVLVGPSKVGKGRGLFVALNEGVERTVLPKGTPICGYAREGVWEKEAAGDKCVGYAFDSVDTGVFFDKRLMPLIECAALVEEGDLGTCVRGHNIFFDNEEEEVQVEADVGDTERYFVPIPPEGTVTVGNMGMFANDIAYYPGCSEEEYVSESESKSILELAWRMELEEDGDFAGKRVRPTWPVVILSRDVAFNNGPDEPMEVGVLYGWKYWDEQRKKGKSSGNR